MHYAETTGENAFSPIEDPLVLDALNAIGRSVNIASTYGNRHPVFHQTVADAMVPLQALFADRRKITVGAFNGMMTIDDTPVATRGVLLKSLERRLVRLQISGLRISRGVLEEELVKLVELLAVNEPETFRTEIDQVGLSHIVPRATRLQTVDEDQTVARKEELAASSAERVLVLDEEGAAGGSASGNGEATVRVEQIVAFLKGDAPLDELPGVGEELSRLASDPDRLGRLIMESVAVRQAVGELAGESIGDIVLGCLRRTYEGLRQQPLFQSPEGRADLKKALLLLEKSMLERMRQLVGDPDAELDRKIVQAIREMDEELGFELAASQYVAHREALQKSEQQLQSYVRAKGAQLAEELISGVDFPASEWRRIVVQSRRAVAGRATSSIVAGLDTLTAVFERLEQLMKSERSDGKQVEALLGQASEALDETLCSTREKLDALSAQILPEGETGTIGGQAPAMDRKELLSSISEISQELMQPLTAITTTLEMLQRGYAGDLNQDQKNMLQIASNSGDHLTYLMNELIDIVGYPVNKGVDERFHTTSDDISHRS